MIAFIHGIFAIIWFIFGLFIFRFGMKEEAMKIPGGICFGVFVLDILLEYWPSYLFFAQAFTGEHGPWASAIWLGSFVVAVFLWLFD